MTLLYPNLKKSSLLVHLFRSSIHSYSRLNKTASVSAPPLPTSTPTSTTVATALNEKEMYANALQEILEALKIPKNKEPVKETDASLSCATPQDTLTKCIELRLFSYETKILANYTEFCRRAALYIGFECDLAKQLKPKIQKWSVLSSPHVHKKAWTQFERRTYTRVISIYNGHPNVVSKYLWYIQTHLPSELKISATLFHYESLSHFISPRSSLNE